MDFCGMNSWCHGSPRLSCSTICSTEKGKYSIYKTGVWTRSISPQYIIILVKFNGKASIYSIKVGWTVISPWDRSLCSWWLDFWRPWSWCLSEKMICKNARIDLRSESTSVMNCMIWQSPHIWLSIWNRSVHCLGHVKLVLVVRLIPVIAGQVSSVKDTSRCICMIAIQVLNYNVYAYDVTNA